MRVLRYSRADGLEEVGAWIADGGSNFWGVEQLTADNGERLIAGSDRDYGLVILRYTGTGRRRPDAGRAERRHASRSGVSASTHAVERSRRRVRKRTITVG